MFAGEGRPLCGHEFLDVGVADAAAYGPAAVFCDDLGDGPGADQVVDDGGARLVAEDGGCNERRGERARDGAALFVHEEHPVGVAVERQADVGSGGQHPFLEGHQVGALEGVGGVVGEGAVEVRVHDLEVEGQAVEHGWDDEAAHAVGGVGHDRQGCQGGGVDKGADVVCKGVEQVERGCCAGRSPAGLWACRQVGLHLGQAGVGAHGPGR